MNNIDQIIDILKNYNSDALDQFKDDMQNIEEGSQIYSLAEEAFQTAYDKYYSEYQETYMETYSAAYNQYKENANEQAIQAGEEAISEARAEFETEREQMEEENKLFLAQELLDSGDIDLGDLYEGWRCIDRSQLISEIAETLDGGLLAEFTCTAAFDYSEIYEESYSSALDNALEDFEFQNEPEFDFTFDCSEYIEIFESQHFVNSSGEKVSIISEESNGRVVFELEGKEYVANSMQTLRGRDGNDPQLGDFPGIYSMTNCEVLQVYGHAYYVFYVRYSDSAMLEPVVLRESINETFGGTGLLDYKNILYSDILEMDDTYLVEIDGIVYNPNEAGNYLWGMVLSEVGCFIDPNNIAEWGTQRLYERADEEWEQRAITEGKDFNKNHSVEDLQRGCEMPVGNWREYYNNFYME